MKRKLLFILVGVPVAVALAGWLAFGLTVARTGKRIAALEAENTELKMRTQSLRHVGDDIRLTTDTLSQVISTLEKLKAQLARMQSKIEQGVNHGVPAEDGGKNRE